MDRQGSKPAPASSGCPQTVLSTFSSLPSLGACVPSCGLNPLCAPLRWVPQKKTFTHLSPDSTTAHRQRKGLTHHRRRTALCHLSVLDQPEQRRVGVVVTTTAFFLVSKENPGTEPSGSLHLTLVGSHSSNKIANQEQKTPNAGALRWGFYPAICCCFCFW